MTTYVPLILSFVLVFFVIAVATLLQKKNLVSEEVSRKIVHIGVANWWFFMFMFDNVWVAIIAPVIFVILNYISHRKNIFSAIERKGNSDLGTVYFPISLVAIVLLSHFFDSLIAGTVAILILGYGDGITAIVGKKFGKKKVFNDKSLVGTLTMFVVSAIVTTLVLVFGTSLSALNVFLFALIISIVASVVELITPKGFDNLSIPLVVFGVFQLLNFLLG